MLRDDAPAGPWANIGTPNSEAFIGFAAALILPELVNKPECRDPYTMAVEHAKKLMAALAKKGGEQRVFKPHVWYSFGMSSSKSNSKSG